MTDNFQKPENALKRAEEFLYIGEVNAAAESLYVILSSNRHKNWTPKHEDVMRLFLSICFDMRNEVMAKDGLAQFRNICQNSNNPTSMKTITTEFFERIKAKIGSLKQEYGDVCYQDDKLTCDVPPDLYIYNTLNGLNIRERMSLEYIQPWLQYLNDNYRNIVECLRFNNPLYDLYKQLYEEAFDFCLMYKRTRDFGRFCDSLRRHLRDVMKSTAAELNSYTEKFRVVWNMDLALKNVDIRFHAFDIAVKLNSWDEAYQLVQDINTIILDIDSHLIREVKMSCFAAYRPMLFAKYLESASKIFLASNNLMLHAYSWLMYYQHLRLYQKGFKPQEWAIQVLLATLSIPTKPDEDCAEDLPLLFIKGAYPSRISILGDLGELGILSELPAELNQLFEALEKDFQPLTLVDRCVILLQSVSSEERYQVYTNAIKKLIIQRLLEQLPTIYTTMKLDHFYRLIEPLGFTPIQVENWIVNGVKSGSVHVRISYQLQSLLFESFTVESFDVKHQLQLMYQRLSSVMCRMHGSSESSAASAEVEAPTYEFDALERKRMVDEYRIECDRMIQDEKHRQEEMKSTQEDEIRMKEEIRLEEEKNQREQQKVQEMRNLDKLRIVKEALRSLGKNAESVKASDLDSMDTEKIIQKSQMKKYKEMEEAKKSQLEAVKKVNYKVRALRECEQQALASYSLREKATTEAYLKTDYDGFASKSRYQFEISQRLRGKLEVIESELNILRARLLRGRCAGLKSMLVRRREENEADERRKAEEAERRRREEEEAERRRRDEEERRRREMMSPSEYYESQKQFNSMGRTSAPSYSSESAPSYSAAPMMSYSSSLSASSSAAPPPPPPPSMYSSASSEAPTSTPGKFVPSFRRNRS